MNAYAKYAWAFAALIVGGIGSMLDFPLRGDVSKERGSGRMQAPVELSRPRISVMADSEGVDSLAFTPDGKTLASGGWEGIKLWDVATGRQKAHFKAKEEKGTATCLAISPDGKTLASGGYDNTIRLRDIGTGKELAHLRMVRNVVFLAFTMKGKSLIACDKECRIKMWDVATRKERSEFVMQMPAAHAVAFSSDGKYVAMAAFDGVFQLREVASDKEWNNPVRSEVGSMVFTPDSKSLVIGLSDRVQVWDVAKRKPRTSFNTGRGGIIEPLAIAPDGKRLITEDRENRKKMWDLEDGKLLTTFPARKPGAMVLVISPDGKTLATGNADGTLQLWDLPTR